MSYCNLGEVALFPDLLKLMCSPPPTVQHFEVHSHKITLDLVMSYCQKETHTNLHCVIYIKIKYELQSPG